jgi:hypothetical protein
VFSEVVVLSEMVVEVVDAVVVGPGPAVVVGVVGGVPEAGPLNDVVVRSVVVDPRVSVVVPGIVVDDVEEVVVASGTTSKIASVHPKPL